MHYIQLYFLGFTLGIIPALVFLLFCGAYSALVDSAREIVGAS